MISLRFLKSTCIVFGASLLANAPVFSASSYYPTSFENDFPTMQDKSLKSAIRKVLVSSHWKRNGKADVLVKNCKNKRAGSCYRYKVLSYKQARKILFKQLHNEKKGRKHYVRDLYCGKKFPKKGRRVSNGHLSCEHTWPRSKFNKKQSWSAQESDLHHLFPVDSRANSIRSNHDFGEGGEPLYGCSLSRRGDRLFEPPSEHKGNVARALFYFSVRYKAPINSKQERILKIWHQEDPVDEQERDRNQKIYKVQRTRNPFIDFPEMVGQISDF